MSYSRWGASRWYTFWACQDDATENRETAFFEICIGPTFTAKEIRDNIERCLEVSSDSDELRCGTVSDADREELRGYMLEFLVEVDAEYPEGE